MGVAVAFVIVADPAVVSLTVRMGVVCPDGLPSAISISVSELATVTMSVVVRIGGVCKITGSPLVGCVP